MGSPKDYKLFFIAAFSYEIRYVFLFTLRYAVDVCAIKALKAGTVRI